MREPLGNLHLYAVTVLIWGSTWLAIKFQLGAVPPSVSVVWRFGLASLILLAYALWKGLKLRYSPREHLWLALEGLSMFGINYLGVYLSERFLTSGLVAVIFSLMAFMSPVLMRIFYATRLRAKEAAGACIGIAGVVLVFWPEVTQFSATSDAMLGVLYGLVSVLIASLGNIVATRNQRAGMAIVPVHVWSMLYGALAVALFALLNRDPFVFDWSFPYVASLLYLSLFGSVLAFGAYVTLMGRIGPGRAAYASVAIPVVALLFSTLWEGLRWEIPMAIGVVLCVAGNLLVHSRDRA